ncbi:MAG: ribonuclease E activity regulator RraA, partial [Pseudomonadales bacterium]|nr:ribonuclease E activity regulator RraA [Pseudomonadales bacterium]
NSLVAKAVDEPGEGRVLVVDGGGSLRCALVGDNLAEKAAGSGWAGIIVYGCIRDVDVIGGIELGVHALAANPMRSVKRDVGLRDEPVTFAGVTFTPGEFAYGDNNGIIVSSRSLPESAIS